jgi:Flp pilus assembly protein TadB
MTPRTMAHLVVISVFAILLGLPWLLWDINPLCTAAVLVGALVGIVNVTDTRRRRQRRLHPYRARRR